MASTKVRPVAPPRSAVEYPHSDGKIMAASPKHVDTIVYTLATLRNWFAGYSRVQVGANMLLYYQEGDSTKQLAPDLFVVRGLDALPEPSYRLWEAGRPPTFVLEVASQSTEGWDGGEKQALYASMGVAEYWRFHPTGLLKKAKQEGARLEGGILQGLGYEPLPSHPDGSIHSEVLGLGVRVDDRARRTHLLRFRDPKTGNDLLTFEESESGRLLAEERLRAEIAARHQSDRARYAAERDLREAEQARRAEVAARRDTEEENARLRAQIARLERG